MLCAYNIVSLPHVKLQIDVCVSSLVAPDQKERESTCSGATKSSKLDQERKRVMELEKPQSKKTCKK